MSPSLSQSLSVFPLLQSPASSSPVSYSFPNRFRSLNFQFAHISLFTLPSPSFISATSSAIPFPFSFSPHFLFLAFLASDSYSCISAFQIFPAPNCKSSFHFDPKGWVHKCFPHQFSDLKANNHKTTKHFTLPMPLVVFSRMHAYPECSYALFLSAPFPNPSLVPLLYTCYLFFVSPTLRCPLICFVNLNASSFTSSQNTFLFITFPFPGSV